MGTSGFLRLARTPRCLSAVGASVAVVAVLGGGFPVGARAVGPTTVLVTAGSGYANDYFPYLGTPSVSAGGRFVAFDSDRSDVLAGDTNDSADVFVRDTRTGTTVRVSVSNTGAQANDGSSGPVDISAGGRFVLFESSATNLVAHDTNDFDDVFLRDRKLGTTRKVPYITSYVEGEWVMSGNGRYFAAGPPGYSSTVIWYDRVDRVMRHIDIGNDQSSVFGISDNGRAVLSWGTTTGYRVWHPLSGRLVRFDQTRDGGFAGDRHLYADALSADGHVVMFSSDADNLVRRDTNGRWDVFVRNLVTHHTSRISIGNLDGRQANRGSFGLGLSGDGRLALFTSHATNLIAGDTNQKMDIFVRDRRSRTTKRCNLSAAGAQAPKRSTEGAISRNGLYVAFLSASPLAPGDANGRNDVFERGPAC